LFDEKTNIQKLMLQSLNSSFVREIKQQMSSLILKHFFPCQMGSTEVHSGQHVGQKITEN